MSQPDIAWKLIFDPASIRPNKSLLVWHREGFAKLAYVAGTDDKSPGQLTLRYVETPLDWADFTHFVYMDEPKGFVRKPNKGDAILREPQITA